MQPEPAWNTGIIGYYEIVVCSNTTCYDLFFPISTNISYFQHSQFSIQLQQSTIFFQQQA